MADQAVSRDRVLGDHQHAAFDEHGYLILRGWTSAGDVDELVRATERMIEKGRRGEARVNFVDDAKQHMSRTSGYLEPDRYDPAWTRWQERDVLPVIEALVGGPARHSLFGNLAAGGGQPYKQGWHRDLCEAGADDELKILQWVHRRAVQLNAPLAPGDRFLQVVPGSHRRPSTPEELAVVQADATGDMPGMVTVELEPGDIVFYNFNLWHRGWNPAGARRWTLHICYWRDGIPVMAHEAGQTASIRTPGHLDRMPAASRLLMERYLAAYPQDDPISTLAMARASGG